MKSYLKKDSLLASFIFCIKLLNDPFSSRLRNNSGTHFFLFLLFFFFILNKTTSCKNKKSFPSESDKMSKELQNSDLIYVNLITDVFKITVKYHQKIIVKYDHLSPSGNRVLDSIVEICHCLGVFSIIFRNSRLKVLFRKDVLKICNKFTGEHPC